MSRTVRVATQVALASIVLSGLTIGLAFAGVDLPGTAAEKALEKVSGLELPNQGTEGSGNSVNEDVKAVIDSDTEKGCEFGQAVAAEASQNRKGTGGSDTDPCAQGGGASSTHESKGSKATGEEKSAEGRAKGSTNGGGSSDKGAGNAGVKDDSDPDDEDLGSDKAGTHNDAGREKAAEASSKAQSKKPDDTP